MVNPIPNPDYLPTLSELHEFRTALALSKAHHNEDRAQIALLVQLIENADHHVNALRTIIWFLLMELDTTKRDANEVLTSLIEQSATADVRNAGNWNES